MDLIDVSASLEPIDSSAPEGMRGLIEFANRHFLIPHEFARGVLESLAEMIEAVLACSEWPDSDGWWETGPATARRRYLDSASWLFG
jgi:hypothetical protein